MKEKSITVDIRPDGSVNIEANGFSDASCLKATEDLEKALGTVKHREKKAEALKPVQAGQKLTVGSK